MFIVLCSNVQTIYIYIYKKCIDTSLRKSNVNIVNNDLWPSTAMTRWEWIVWAYLLLIMSCSTVQNMHAYSSLRINKMLYRAGSQLQWKHCSKCGGGGKHIMARPESWLCKYPSCKGTITLEIQRQTITRKAIVSHLHICLTTITCSSCPSCSEQCLCVHIIMHTSENCHSALFQFKWKAALLRRAGSPSLTLS